MWKIYPGAYQSALAMELIVQQMPIVAMMNVCESTTATALKASLVMEFLSASQYHLHAMYATIAVFMPRVCLTIGKSLFFLGSI
jgi:hypothetical protein